LIVVLRSFRGATTLSQRKRLSFTRLRRCIIRARIIMAAANSCPAVASRLAKYFDDFRVLTLLGAQPLGAMGPAPPISPYGAGAAIKSVTLAWPAWQCRR
jgi:hypothetical protein